MEEISFPAAFACAAARRKIPEDQTLVAYLWAWLENQVMAAIKLVPLGQTDGQQILLALGQALAEVAEHAAEIADEELGGSAPALAILSSRHETQYSRLFSLVESSLVVLPHDRGIEVEGLSRKQKRRNTCAKIEMKVAALVGSC